MVSMDAESFRGPDLKLYVRDVKDRQGRKRPITLRSWSTIKDVKDALQQIIHVPPSAQHLYFGPLLTSGIELPNHRTLHDAGIYRSGETLLLDIQGGNQKSPLSSSVSLSHSNDVCLSSSMFDSTPKALRSRVEQARRGLAVGYKPEFVFDGSGGTYFLHDSRKNKIAVFKPSDEEPYSEFNPKNYIQSADQSLCLREGVKPGEACIREVAAFLLDHGNFSGVPMTTLAEARHPSFNTNGARLTVAEGGASMGSHSINPLSTARSPHAKKVGSFQEFIDCECTMDDISPSKLGVEEVHKIAILDIRIMNADRNSANLLVQRAEDNSLKLVPIDHGYCLRTVCDVSWMDWCWLDWPQLKEPLSAKHKKYIENLDIEADAKLLQERLNIAQEAIDYFRASSALLKAGVKAGLTLYDIAIMCCRNDNLAEIPSMMEKLFSVASELAYAAVENERWHHAAASRAIEEQLSPQPRVGPASISTFFSKSLRKSASSAGLQSLESKKSRSLLAQALLDQEEYDRESPGMAQSSASDSSSDSGDGDDPVDEWAAGVIAEVKMDQLALATSRRSRRDSISDDASSDSLSSSPKGFWTVRPGSPPLGTSPDDGSVSWSPQSPPKTLVQGVSTPPTMGKPSVAFKTPVVSFASDVAKASFIPPKTVSIEMIRDKPLARQESGLTRSKSYSALPDKTNHADSIASRSLKPSSEEYAHYRMYFHKFIDLVIVRETTAALGGQAKS